jgi:hypothetical protein
MPGAPPRHPGERVAPLDTPTCAALTAPPESTQETAPETGLPSVIPLPYAPPSEPKRREPKRKRAFQKKIRFSAEELAEFERRASEAGLSLAAYTRAATLGSPGPRHRRRVSMDRAALVDAMVKFSRLNNNQNQLAHAGNVLVLIAQERGSAELAAIAAELAKGIELARREAAPVYAAILAALGHDRQG